MSNSFVQPPPSISRPKSQSNVVNPNVEGRHPASEEIFRNLKEESRVSQTANKDEESDESGTVEFVYLKGLKLHLITTALEIPNHTSYHL